MRLWYILNGYVKYIMGGENMKRSFRFGALAMALLMAVLLMPTLSYADEGGIEGMPEELTIFCGSERAV